MNCITTYVIRRTSAAILVVAVLVTPCRGITINTVFRSSGESLSGFGTAGEAPHNTVGAGNLQAIVAVAVDYWENVYSDPFTLTIQYGWFPRAGTITGTHVLLTQGGTPNRETSGALAFDNDGTTEWFIDPTPASASEYASFTNYSDNLGGGTMNIGREYTSGLGDAAARDLFTSVVHEMGHALGLSAANNAYNIETGDLDIDITAPLPFAGAAIPVNSGNAHLNLDHPVMRSSWPRGIRRLLSDADILANAQISRFTQVNLNATVPEPAATTLVGLGVALLTLVSRATRLCAGARQRC